ncbi:MAG TPA: hypothetical protein VLH16_01235 [Bacteroidales bacterium]|nr:hypothetical protein [Bacteroidales bacterium]
MFSVQKIWHCEAYLTGIFLGFDEGLKQIVKKTSALWSRTHWSWYLDYNAESCSKIKEVFPDHRVVKNSKDKTPVPAVMQNLLEAWDGLRFIQALPGHSSIKTTTIYAHLTKKKFTERIISSLGRLMEELNTSKNTEKCLVRKDIYYIPLMLSDSAI